MMAHKTIGESSSKLFFISRRKKHELLIFYNKIQETLSEYITESIDPWKITIKLYQPVILEENERPSSNNNESSSMTKDSFISYKCESDDHSYLFSVNGNSYVELEKETDTLIQKLANVAYQQRQSILIEGAIKRMGDYLIKLGTVIQSSTNLLGLLFEVTCLGTEDKTLNSNQIDLVNGWLDTVQLFELNKEWSINKEDSYMLYEQYHLSLVPFSPIHTALLHIKALTVHNIL